MLGQYFQCPYCRHQLFDDGTLAGQLVACQTCGGKMQIPGVTPPPMPAAPPPLQVTPVASSPRRRNHRREPEGWPWSVRITVSLVCFLLAGGLFFGLGGLGKIMKDHGEEMIKDARQGRGQGAGWCGKGYAEGKAWGQSDRNDGGQPNVVSAFRYATAADPNEVARAETDPLRYPLGPDYYEIKEGYPKRGTEDFGELHKGFQAGYFEGY